MSQEQLQQHLAFEAESTSIKKEAHSFERRERHQIPDKDLQGEAIEKIEDVSKIAIAYEVYLKAGDIGLIIDEQIVKGANLVAKIYKENKATIKPLLEAAAKTPQTELAVKLADPIIDYKVEEANKIYKKRIARQEERKTNKGKTIKTIEATIARLRQKKEGSKEKKV